MTIRTLKLDDLPHIGELKEAILSPDGKHAALISSHWNLEADRFETVLHLLFCGGAELERLWSLPVAGARCLQMSPNGSKLAFLRASRDEGCDELALVSLKDGSLLNAPPQPLVNAAELVWHTDNNSLFLVCDEEEEAGEAAEQEKPLYSDYWHIESIPQRWSWWRKRRVLIQIFLKSDIANAPSAAVKLAGPCYELRQPRPSPDGDKLYIIEERCTNELQPQLFLLRLNVGTRLEQIKEQTKEQTDEPTELMLPNSMVGAIVPSPSGRYLAFVGSRTKVLEASPYRLGEPPLSRLSEEPYLNPVNAYDSRIHILDLHTLMLHQLGSEAPLSASIPIGMAPIAQDIYWSSEEEIYFIATSGHTTVFARQRLFDEGSLEWSRLGVGSSRSHSFASDGTCFCIHSEQGAPFVPAIYDPRTQSLKLFSQSIPLVPQQVVWSPPIELEHISASGAWLYLPQEQAEEPGSMPLIVYIYGGSTPLCMAYEDTHQLLTAQGYAVLVMNASGSAGYGKERADLHRGDWGKIAVPETIETVKLTLEAYPFLDHARVALYGGSYGGFLTMKCLTETSIFKAACSISGISNIASYWGASHFGYQYGLSALPDLFPWSNPDFFTAASPLFHADKINTPLLLLHGEIDGVVPLVESEQMFTALKVLKKEVSLITFHEEDHGLRGRPRVKLMQRRLLLAWFDKHLRQKNEAWAAYTAGEVDQAIQMS
ncbi:prolyl oligopeptidase family serine peptidase [Paenibacillus sp. KS-LC4]|uniref:S9 family peptidase n=1 Tax=Paenibacillus sp. KS-LC4 TaxID=2979727 RepID=UPI0030CBE2AD